MYQKKLKSNIWKFAVHSITNKRSYMTILSVYLLTLPDTTANTIGLLLFAGNIAGFIFELPGGYLADKMGHKRALIIARILMLVSTLFFLVGSSVNVFIVGSVLLNIGIAFMSGTNSAFMYETLIALGREKDFAKVMGRVGAIGFGVPVLLIVIVPFLAEISFKIPFLIAAIVDVIGLITVLTFVQPEKQKVTVKEIGVQNFRTIIAEGSKYNFFRYNIFVALMGGVTMGLTGFMEPYQILIGIPIAYLGIFWGISRGLIAILMVFNDFVHRTFTLHQYLALKILFFLVALLLLGTVTNTVAIVALIIIFPLQRWGFMQAQNHYLLDLIQESNYKATLLSVRGLIEKLVAAVTGSAVGMLITSGGYRLGFLVLGIVSAFVLIIFYLLIIIASRKKASPFKYL